MTEATSGRRRLFLLTVLKAFQSIIAGKTKDSSWWKANVVGIRKQEPGWALKGHLEAKPHALRLHSLRTALHTGGFKTWACRGSSDSDHSTVQSTEFCLLDPGLAFLFPFSPLTPLLSPPSLTLELSLLYLSLSSEIASHYTAQSDLSVGFQMQTPLVHCQPQIPSKDTILFWRMVMQLVCRLGSGRVSTHFV